MLRILAWKGTPNKIMINGITHNDGILNRVSKYRGKISTGLDAGQEGNETNHMVALGYFRICKEKIETKKGTGNKEFAIKTWITNEEIQKKLEIANTPEGAPVCKHPRMIKIVSFYKDVIDMWESFLAMYSSSDGLICKGYGKKSKAKRLNFNDKGEREWREMECMHENCPDYQAKKCRAMGILKCFPSVDLIPSLPYRLETRSINTILAIETGLNDIQYMILAAHRIQEIESKKELPFDGFFLKEMMLLHKKIKSGGREVFITEIQPAKTLIEEIMGPITRMMKNKPMIAQNIHLSLLDQSTDSLLNKLEITDDFSRLDETSIANEFTIQEDEVVEEKLI